MTVAAQLPSQQDSDLICHASNCWLLIHALSQTSTSELFMSNNTVTSFHLAKVAKQHPTMVTRTLLYIAVCMQQLPNSFDQRTLQLTNLNEAMDKYMATASLSMWLPSFSFVEDYLFVLLEQTEAYLRF